MKLCPECEKMYIEAKYTVAPAKAPSRSGKCDRCRKQRWVKEVIITLKK